MGPARGTEVPAPPQAGSSHRHLPTSLALVWLCPRGTGVLRPREGQCQVAPRGGEALAEQPELCLLRDQPSASLSAWILEVRAPGGRWPCPAGPACRRWTLAARRLPELFLQSVFGTLAMQRKGPPGGGAMGSLWSGSAMTSLYSARELQGAGRELMPAPCSSWHCLAFLGEKMGYSHIPAAHCPQGNPGAIL